MFKTGCPSSGSTLLTILPLALMAYISTSCGERDVLRQEASAKEAPDAGFVELQSHGSLSSNLFAFHDSYHGEVFDLCLGNYLTGETWYLTNLQGFPWENASIAASGRFIAYDAGKCTGDDCFSATNVNVYLYDRHVSKTIPLPGLNTPHYDADPAISGTGRFIAFTSSRTGSSNIHLYDRSTSTLLALPGLNTSGHDELHPAISNSGRYIAFTSNRSGARKIYLYDRSAAKLVATPGLQDKPGWDRYFPDLDGSGRFIAFTLLRNGTFNENIALYDRTTQALVSIPGVNTPDRTESRPSLSSDARYLALERNTESIEEGDDHPLILVYDLHTSSPFRYGFRGCGVDERAPSLQNELDDDAESAAVHQQGKK